MGKKVEKVIKEKPVTPVEEEGPKTAEDYVCTGHLEHDFIEICNRLEILEMPIVTLRHPGIAVSGLFDEMESLTPSDVSSAPPLKDQISFFRPSVQVELENDDPKQVKAIYIRGWMIDQRYIFIFQKCLPALSNLHTVNLWNVGLTETTFAAFLVILRQCFSLKSVVLDGNPIAGQPYHQLLSEDSQFQNLTLRNNKIDDAGAKLIGEALSTIKKMNKTVITLNLSFNHITDEGAGYIADGLRLNRTLLWLSLAYNQIGDQGARKLAEVLAPFALTHEEIVERRILLFDSQERQKSSPLYRRPDSKSDRSTSQFGSNTNIDKLDRMGKGGKNTSKKKDKRDLAIQEKPSISNTQLPQKKEEIKLGKRGSIVIDVKMSKSKLIRPGKDKRGATQEQEVVEILNPLIDYVEHHDGDVYLPGNTNLISLNLTHNKISESGLKAFLTAVQTQIQSSKFNPDGRTTVGLLRLAITPPHLEELCHESDLANIAVYCYIETAAEVGHVASKTKLLETLSRFGSVCGGENRVNVSGPVTLPQNWPCDLPGLLRHFMPDLPQASTPSYFKKFSLVELAIID